MTARESSGESGSVVLCQSMYIPVETSEPGVTSGLLQLVNEIFFCLFLSHFQNQSITKGGREGEGSKEEGGGRGREMMETVECLKSETHSMTEDYNVCSYLT